MFVRANPHLAEIIEILEIHRQKYKSDAEAREYLRKADNEWIDEEFIHCMSDARYFISNYYAYRDEKEGFKGLYPLFDSQEILHDNFRALEKQYGQVRALVLKARQMGATVYIIGEYFHKTIFSPHINGISVGKDQSQTESMFSMFSSALDFLPWWMKPRINIFQTGSKINFDEKDEKVRSVRPGLKTWLYWENANKPSGVGRGQTFNRAILDELAFWENGSQLSKSLRPTMNSPDGFYVMSSTANGRNDFWHNLWRRAERGEINWNPIFIPFYRREKTYSLPIAKEESFALTEEETKMRERIFLKDGYLIKDEMFNWMRSVKNEFVATDGDSSMFEQEYASEPESAFQSSAATAFPRAIIRKFSRGTKEPKYVGECSFDMAGWRPQISLRELGFREEAQYGIGEDRLHVWKKPEPECSYCVGADVALGAEGGDFSVAQVVKLGKWPDKDEQVACWRGRINPNAFAGIVVALGTWYNEALAAVEVNSYGEATNFRVTHEYDYTNVYRFKRLDRIGKGMVTNIVGFLTTSKSADSLMAKMSEGFLEDSIVINCRYTMDEFNDFTENGAKGKGAHDDLVDALMIALFCGHEGEVRDRQQGTPPKAKGAANTFTIRDRFGNRVGETHSRVEAERIAKLHLGSITTVRSGATATVRLGGVERKVPADFQNTDFSPVYDKPGTAARLHEDEGVAAEDITPEMIRDYEEMEENRENNPDSWLYY